MHHFDDAAGDHDRVAGHPPSARAGDVDFDALYEGTPPWDIGRPQEAFAALAREGALVGRVLDAGCGTGEHALMAAALGLDATGVDTVPAAVARAVAKARHRGLDARFIVCDARELAGLDERFDTVLDCGLFHVFDDEDRIRYVDALAAVVSPGGRLYLLCFSEHVPGDSGPRRVTREAIRSSFRHGWTVDEIRDAVIAATFLPDGVPAWCATITRTP